MLVEPNLNTLISEWINGSLRPLNNGLSFILLPPIVTQNISENKLQLSLTQFARLSEYLDEQPWFHGDLFIVF